MAYDGSTDHGDPMEVVAIDRRQLETLKETLESLTRGNHTLQDRIQRMAHTERSTRGLVIETLYPGVLSAMEPTEMEVREAAEAGENSSPGPDPYDKEAALIRLRANVEPLINQLKDFDLQ
jgi:hypothetical protein